MRTEFVTRRGILAALTGVAVASLTGCGPFGKDQQPDPGPHPLAEHLQASIDLATAYETTITALPALANTYQTIRDNHWAHADELATASHEPRPSRNVSPSASPSTPATLLAAEQEAAQRAYEATVKLPGTYTALLGAIAACRATHVDALT